MTKEEIFEKLQTEVTIRGLSPQTYYTYKCGLSICFSTGPTSRMRNWTK